MLKDNFYTISSLAGENNSYKIMLKLNAGHTIFEGHFPGQPVVPGACMLQMVKEITEIILSKKIRLIKAGQLKFMQTIIPGENNTLQMEISCSPPGDGTAGVSATISNETSVCFKFTGLFQLLTGGTAIK